MTSTLHTEIVTPERILFSGRAGMVGAPGTEGDFGVLPGHAPLLSTLRPGVVTVEAPGEAPRRFAVLSGLADVTPERCTILADTALDISGITSSEAQRQLADARAALDDALTDEQKADARRALALAEIAAQAVTS